MATKTLHLWWNGYDHAPGETEKDAELWLRSQSGEEDCTGDGWRMVADGVLMTDEDGRKTKETAAAYAQALAGMAAP